MVFVLNLLIFLVLATLGVIVEVKTLDVVRLFGKNSWAERVIGSGGSYTLWKIIGVILIFIGLLFLTGRFSYLWR